MPKAKCPKCGRVYYGWALKQEPQKYCSECGAPLNIEDDSQTNTPQESDNSIKIIRDSQQQDTS